MKKTIQKTLIVISIIVSSVAFSNAQELGVRFGDVSGGSVAIDGIFSTGQFSRVHADVSFGHGFAVDALWDFFYRPLGGEAFNWYMGFGPYLGVFENDNNEDGTNFNLGVAFEIGLEYHFNSVPIALGVDYRPTLEVIDNTDFHAEGFGLNVRYVFGQ